MKTAVTIRHVAFEDLDAFAPLIGEAGFSIHYHDVGQHDPRMLEAEQAIYSPTTRNTSRTSRGISGP